MKNLKKIISVILSFAMIIGSMGSFSIVSKAADPTPINLTLTGAMFDGGGADSGTTNCSNIWLAGNANGIDSPTWNVFQPIDETDGIWVEGERDADAYLVNHNNAGGWFASGFTATAGQTITIKGTFKCESSYVEVKEVQFKWSGSAWKEVLNATPVTLTLTDALFNGGGADTGTTNCSYLWLAGSASGLTSPNFEAFAPVDGTAGIWVEDQHIDGGVLLNHSEQTNGWRAQGFTATAGQTITIKGIFKYESSYVEIEEVQFKWNGTSWESVVEEAYTTYTGSLTRQGAEQNDARNTAIYLNGKDGFSEATTGWDDAFVPADEESGVFVNGVRQENSSLKNYSTNQFYIEGFGSVEQDVTVAIKGTFQNESLKKKFVITESAFVWNGTAWVDENSTSTMYKSFKYDGINSATGYSDESSFWNVYLHPSVEVPGTAWSTTFVGLKMQVGDGEVFDISVMKSGHEGTTYFTIANDKLPKDVARGTKITIKAGTADSNDGSDGIKLTEDFVMYALGNGDGFTTEEPPATITYKEFTLKSINAATGYSEGNGWFFYLDPSVTLPGTADSTYFTGLKMSVDGVESEIQVWKAAHQGTAFIIVPQDILPKNFTKDTKIQFLSGKATSNDGSDGIELTETFTIYANQYGMRVDKFAPKPNYTNITLKSINAATGYSEGTGWFFYLDPSVTLPGTADSTYFTGLRMSVDGEESEIRVWKAAHQGTAFIIVPQDILPRNFTKDTKIQFLSGEAISNDGSNGIELSETFTIYANQYGMSTTGFLSIPDVIQSGARLILDRDTAFGGNEGGLYLNTNDKFPTDTTWGTKIQAITYDDNSGIFLNGQKLENATLVRYADGKIFIGLQDAGIRAKDKDQVTVKGSFLLNNKIVSYAEVSFYYNGQTWGTTYEPPKPETYTTFSVNDVNGVSGWNEGGDRWDVYLNVNHLLPGEGDKIYFNNLTLEVNGSSVETQVFHAGHEDCLFFIIDKNVLPKNTPDGTKITLKAGKALATDHTTGINLVKDYTFYTWKGTLTGTQPTKNTEWKEVSPAGLFSTAKFNPDIKAWLFHVKLNEKLPTESGTYYMEFPVMINGVKHLLKVQQDGEFLMVTIPDSILSGSAKTATITIPAGATAVANAGYDGIRFTEELELYLFNGVISERKFDKIEKTEAKILGVQTVMEGNGIYHVYLRLNTEFPGSAWYENYDDFTFKYNGKQITGMLRKSDSSNDKIIYFQIDSSKVGGVKEGDILEIPGGTEITCGGFEVTFTNDFMMMFTDGLWSQYMNSDVKAPEDNASLWEVARFDKEYIPMGENGSVLFSNEDEYNAITSTKPMKDYTISFSAKKVYDDETTPSFGVILRGNAINEDEPMTRNLLYGYVITFSAIEQEAPEDSDEPNTWGGFIQLWKNGENYSLVDQYRVNYTMKTEDHPFFQYDKEYRYSFSIYNVTDTMVCIEARVNDKLVMRYYDEAGSDPMDPAVNEGCFQVFAGCPTYITDDTTELTEVLSEKEECEVGEKVRVAVTYPSELNGAEFTVDKEGATVENGMFVAEKAGTYTISGSNNGKKLASTTITVKEAETASEDGTALPILPIVLGGLAVIVVIAAAILIFRMKRSKKIEDSNDSRKETDLPE